MHRPVHKRIAHTGAFLEAAGDVREAVAVEVRERVHRETPVRLPVATQAGGEQVRALIAIRGAVDSLGELCPEKMRALPLEALVDGERRHVGIAAGVQVRNTGRDLERLRGIGFGVLRRSGRCARDGRDYENDESSGGGATWHDGTSHCQMTTGERMP